MSMTLYPKCTHCENPTKKHTLIQTYIALIDFIILYHIIVNPTNVKPMGGATLRPGVPGPP